MSETYYVIKMKSVRVPVPNEFIEKGLDGFKEYANKLRCFYPETETTIWEVSEKLIEE